MGIQSVAGTTLGISAGVPATFNAAGYGALTFAVIGEITDLGEFGRIYELIKHNPIGTRGTRKLKGSFDEGQMPLKLALDTNNAGQVIAKAASTSDADHAFAVTAQNGDIYYFSAQVMSFKRGFGTVNNIVSGSITLELTSSSTGVGVVEDLA